MHRFALGMSVDVRGINPNLGNFELPICVTPKTIGSDLLRHEKR